MTGRATAILVWIVAAVPAPVRGQEATAAMLTGTVWDSLSARPLAGAEVLLDGSVTVGRSDDEGLFTLRAPEGRHTLSFHHPDVSAWSVLTRPAELELAAGQSLHIVLATPSAATVLDRACPGQGAVVGGQVRDLLTLVPLASASVDVRAGAPGGGDSRMITVRADADGSFAVCLPEASAEEVRARLGSARSRPVELTGSMGPVYVQDLFVRVSEPAQVRGLVRDAASGEALADASVEIVGTRLRTLTRPDGRFVFRGVPPGEISITVARTGYGRRVVELSAQGGSTVELTLDVFPEAIALDSMIVSVRGGTLDAARAGTRFDGLTRPEIEKLLPRSIGFDDLLRNANIPGLKVREATFQTGFGTLRPGVCVETGRTSSPSPAACQMVEIYLNDVRVLEPETLLLMLDPGSIDRFQLLSRTAAGIQYGGTPRAHNGVLLIYTRGR